MFNQISKTTVLRWIAIVGNFSYHTQVNSIFRCNNWLLLRAAFGTRRKYAVPVWIEHCSTPSSRGIMQELCCSSFCSTVRFIVVAGDNRQNKSIVCIFNFQNWNCMKIRNCQKQTTSFLPPKENKETQTCSGDIQAAWRLLKIQFIDCVGELDHLPVRIIGKPTKCAMCYAGDYIKNFFNNFKIKKSGR